MLISSVKPITPPVKNNTISLVDQKSFNVLLFGESNGKPNLEKALEAMEFRELYE